MNMGMNKKINKNREQYEIHSKPTPYIYLLYNCYHRIIYKSKYK